MDDDIEEKKSKPLSDGRSRNMKVTNLLLSLLARERKGSNSQKQQFEEFLEYKTATSSTIHFNYNLQEQTKSTFVVAFSPDRTKIATSHGNHSVKISDCYTFKILLTLKGHPRTPWCVTFHPTINPLLATGCLGGQVRLWDLNKITNDDNVIYQSQAVISSLAFHPTEDILTISTHNKLIFYDWNKREILKTIQMKHHSQSIRLIRFLPNGRKLITAIANTSSQYCKPERFNVSTRGDSSGNSVVQTVSCMRLQQQTEDVRDTSATSVEKEDSEEKLSSSHLSATSVEKEDSEEKLSSSHLNKILKRKGSYGSEESHGANKKSCQCKHIKCSKQEKNSESVETNSCKTNTSANCHMLSDKECNEECKCEGTSSETASATSSRCKGNVPHESTTATMCKERSAISVSLKQSKSRKNSTLQCPKTSEAATSTECCGDNVSSNSGESAQGTSSTHRDSAINWTLTPSIRHYKRRINVSDQDIRVSGQVSSERRERNRNGPSRLRHANTRRQPNRSEMWNFHLGGNTPSEQNSTSESSTNDVDVSVEGTTSTISGDEYLNFPFSNIHQSTHVTNLLGVQTAVATATARSSHHVHTAVVIASEEHENCEATLQTAVNRAIAGAFAGSGEGAVANNIIDTTHRLQMWDSSLDEVPDIQNENKNIIVPLCKIHNDSSIDVSQDSSYIAVFVPNVYGFPMDAEIKVISLKTESFLHCIYSRKYGPNAVSVSLSSLNNYVMIGLASRKLHWQLSSNQLIGQVLELPSFLDVNYEDICKPVLSIFHKCNANQRSNVSVNTLRFHPTPGMGIIYGTNRGHVQHCHIKPDLDLQEKRLKII